MKFLIEAPTINTQFCDSPRYMKNMDMTERERNNMACNKTNCLLLKKKNKNRVFTIKQAMVNQMIVCALYLDTK
jgi:hypothetical protein